MSLYKITPSFYRYVWSDIFPVLYSVNREQELKRLVAWAKRKRLSKPMHLYESRLRDEQARILRFRLYHRHLVPLAYLIHSVTYSIFPLPSYHRKGAARGYTFKKLTNQSKAYSMLK